MRHACSESPYIQYIALTDMWFEYTDGSKHKHDLKGDHILKYTTFLKTHFVERKGGGKALDIACSHFKVSPLEKYSCKVKVYKVFFLAMLYTSISASSVKNWA